MRVQLLTTLLLLVFLGLAVLASACSQMPVTSMVKLARVDFAATDLSALRAGILLPAGLQPVHGTARLVLVIEPGDGSKVHDAFRLTEAEDAEAAMLTEEAGAGETVFAYKIPPREIRALERFRDNVLAARARASQRPRMTLSVAADACRVANLSGGALPITTYLKTQETKSFVPLARNVDLRTLAGDKPLTLPLCPR